MTTDRQKDIWKAAQRRRRAKPGILEQHAEKQRIRRTDPNFAASERFQQSKKYRTEEGWKKYTLSNLKYRAKKRGFDFDITEEDLEFPSICPVLGIPIEIGHGMSARTAASSPSVDRFDNTKGYVKGNVRVISNRANMLKRDATLEELQAIVRYMQGDVS